MQRIEHPVRSIAGVGAIEAGSVVKLSKKKFFFKKNFFYSVSN